MAFKEVLIYWKEIQFDVVLPENKVWEFALAFGKEFAIEDTRSENKVLKPIDSYDYHQAGYHVTVSVHVSKEQHFYEFLHSFCKEHELPIRESDLKPGHP